MTKCRGDKLCFSQRGDWLFREECLLVCLLLLVVLLCVWVLCGCVRRRIRELTIFLLKGLAAFGSRQLKY